MIISSIRNLLCFALCWGISVTATSPNYGVRSRISDADSFTFNNHNRRRDFVLTFSDEGTPIELEEIVLQLFSTSGELSALAQNVLGAAFSDFLLDSLTDEWSKDTTIQLNSASASVEEVKAVTSRRIRTRNLQEQTGSEVVLASTLTFDGTQPPPSDDTISNSVEKVTKNLDKFVTDYLKNSGLDEFANLSSAKIVGDEDKVEDEDDKDKEDEVDDEDDGDKKVSQVNQELNMSAKTDLNVLVPAVIGGIAVFTLTVFFIAHRRRRNGDLNDISFEDSVFRDDEIDIKSGSSPSKQEIEVNNSRFGGLRNPSMMDGLPCICQQENTRPVLQ